MPTDLGRQTIPELVQPVAHLLTAVFRAQQLQLEAMAALQNSLAAIQRELWDEWISHWAGGVPIDG